MFSFSSPSNNNNNNTNNPTLVRQNATAVASSSPDQESSFLILPRFAGYYADLQSSLSSCSFGSPEPLVCKQARPFLLPSEAIASSSMMSLTSRSRSRRSKKSKDKQQDRDGVQLTYLNAGIRPHIASHLSDNLVYTVQKDIEVSGFQTSTTITTFGAYYFTLSTVTDVSSLSNVFDQYRVTEMEIWLDSNLTENSSPSQGFGRLLTIVDYDDEAVPTSMGSLSDYTNCMATNALVGHYRRFTPHIAVAAYSGAFTSYANETAPWIDTASANVRHYGFKYGIDVQTSVLTYKLNVRVKVQFRNVR
jgi:hypothetical protein